MKHIRILLQQYFGDQVNIIDLKERMGYILFSIDYFGMMGFDGNIDYLGVKYHKRFFTLQKSNLFSFIQSLD